MQQINLYQNEFHVHRDWRRTGIFGAVVLVIVVFGGISASQAYMTSQLRTELATKQKALKNLELTYAALEKNATPKAQDMNLLAELESVKRSNREKSRALNYLSGNDAGNMTGFSYLMQGLGRKRDTINDLWLKKIKFSRGGYDMHLSGSSYQADLLPQFVQALSDEEIYKDRVFKEIKILRSAADHKVMDFILDTRFQSELNDLADTNQSVTLFMARLKQLAGENEVVR